MLFLRAPTSRGAFSFGCFYGRPATARAALIHDKKCFLRVQRPYLSRFSGDCVRVITNRKENRMLTKRNFLTAAVLTVATSLSFPSKAADTARKAGGTANPLTIEVPQDLLGRIMAQVRDHRFLPELPGGAVIAPWEQGISQAWLAEMGEVGANDYDWREAEARLP